jgi:predicted nucleic acid-binding protein
MREKYSLVKARELLFALTKEPGHRFWPTTIDVFEATARFESRMQGAKQITDAYLLAIAIHHNGKLATMDRAILHLAGPEFAKHVELIA